MVTIKRFKLTWKIKMHPNFYAPNTESQDVKQNAEIREKNSYS